MTKWMLAAGAAALAMGVPALANGPQHGNGKGQHGKSEGKGQGDRGQRANGQKAKGDDGNRGMAQASRRNDDDRGKDDRKGWAKSQRDMGKRMASRDRDDDRWDDDDRDDDGRRWDRRAASAAALGMGGYGWNDGCPPGLAKKDNGCMPPGQYKKMVGAALPANYAQSALSGPYAQWYRDNDRMIYRQGDGVIYQVDKASGNVVGVIPSAMENFGYYPLGMTYPSTYNYYNVPTQYRSFYPSDADMAYRYANGAIYGVDPKTSAVQSIVALLAGDLAVGQPLPSTYSVYNVPMSYRSQYYDTPDAMYRYNDGYIYRVDPTTQLVTSVVSALLS